MSELKRLYLEFEDDTTNAVSLSLLAKVQKRKVQTIIWMHDTVTCSNVPEK